MTRLIDIQSIFMAGAKLSEKFPESVIKNEPMLFSSSYGFARSHGSTVTNAVLDLMPESWRGEDVIIDSRVHMLMPGWYPCIPGWHHDDVPRTRDDGQPNYFDPNNNAEHVMIIVNGEIAPTEFAIGRVQLPEVEKGITYGVWHPMIESLISQGKLKAVAAPSDQLVFFDWQSLHRGVRANKAGWRFFLRASRKTTRPFMNEIRRQVQVYLPAPDMGW